jgi:hypothetical protein
MTDVATVPTTLEKRLEAILDIETAFGCPLYEEASAFPRESAREALTEYEYDLREWGALVGLAFGLARTEEPCESLQSVGKRTAEAALAVHLRRRDHEITRPQWARQASDHEATV